MESVQSLIHPRFSRLQRCQTSFNLSRNSVFVSIGNNEEMIQTYFKNKGWTILKKNQCQFTRYHMKWTNYTSEIDYNIFQEGTQLANHIQNFHIYGTKTGLYKTITEYEKIYKNLKFNSTHFLPLTYIIDQGTASLSESEQDFIILNIEGIWISKPAGLNCGRGIEIITDIKKYKEDLLKVKKQNENFAKSRQYKSEYQDSNKKQTVIQKYIEKPLLLENKKFDIRCYLLIACTKPLFVLFHHGYLRLSMNLYTLENAGADKEKFTHLTNNAIQKNHPNYKLMKEDTIWSMIKFENYCIKNLYKTGKNMDDLYHKIKQILCYVISAGANQINRKLGTFELVGCDIMIDEQFNPFLIEMNSNPAIYLETQTQEDIIPHVVKSSLDLVLQIHSNDRNRFVDLSKIENLNLSTFTILINEATNYSYI